MDLLEGETLGAILRRDRRISLPDLSTILLPVLSALEAAHALGIIHRDLKPDNVFLCRTESSLDVKVLDFGVAKLTATDGLAAQTQALTGTGSMVGTPYYMSPEQVFADKDLDARADIWSLGVIMYECLTRRAADRGRHGRSRPQAHHGRRHRADHDALRRFARGRRVAHRTNADGRSREAAAEV